MKNFLQQQLLNWTILLILLCCSSTLSGQVKQLNDFYGNPQYGGDICVNSANLTPDVAVDKLMKQIVETHGSVINFKIVPCNSTNNVQAIVYENNSRYILYNPKFLSRIKNLDLSNSKIPREIINLEVLMILAHEIAHHINLHFGSRDPISIPSMELEADETAGRIMSILGVSVEECQRVLKNLLVTTNGSGANPSHSRRIEAMERGWYDARSPNPLIIITNDLEDDNMVLVSDLEDDNMVLVSGGTFTMGCTKKDGSNCENNEKPSHQVTVSDFYIGRYEVTQKEWREVMGTNPSYFKNCDNCPVEQVSWNDIQKFLSKLNDEKFETYRLPTEAEWEYAARGGSISQGYKYAGSNSLEEAAWYGSNSKNKTHPVGQKQANELGLHDMSGNVGEWCWNWYGKYPVSAQTNPKGLDTGSYRIIRGGAWNFNSQLSRVAYRIFDIPSFRSYSIGFRLARTP